MGAAMCREMKVIIWPRPDGAAGFRPIHNSSLDSSEVEKVSFHLINPGLAEMSLYSASKGPVHITQMVLYSTYRR